MIKKRRPTVKRTSVLLLSILLAIGLFACSDDDNVNGVVDTTQGVRFTQDNATPLAAAVAEALNLFPGLNGIYLVAVNAVETFGSFGGEMPEEGYDLGNLGIAYHDLGGLIAIGINAVGISGFGGLLVAGHVALIAYQGTPGYTKVHPNIESDHGC